MTSALATGSAAPNVFLEGTQWVQELLLGPVATSIAVIAVAAIGLLMLSGRMNIRRSATVLVGCFILFGA
ncbi:TrbC/VirB2 family protein, partial [Brevundimonas sp. P7753]|uniref:TrbC/VirB2 family protein n=1 Tax=Brevundimonas sp. P7753 TaxID=2726982 RepID=UPI0015C1524B